MRCGRRRLIRRTSSATRSPCRRALPMSPFRAQRGIQIILSAGATGAASAALLLDRVTHVPRSAAIRACPSGSLSALLISTPSRRGRSRFCARTPNGQAAVAPASNAMNSRRLIFPAPASRSRRTITRRAARPIPRVAVPRASAAHVRCSPKATVSRQNTSRRLGPQAVIIATG
jgi:hypothetical protein